MNESSARPSEAPQRYAIRLGGHLAARWESWFEGMTLTRQHDGTTTVEGLVVDQAALHGLLHKIRDLGLPLVSVVPLETDPYPGD